MIQKLTGKVTVVTGASKGIAAAIPVSQKSRNGQKSEQ
jgi:short-subunit dehydrogenase